MLVRLLMAILVAVISLGGAPAGAQDVVAHVKTWTGQVWRLSQPSLEVFYTIVPPPKDDGGGAPAPTGPATGAAGAYGSSVVGGASRGAMLFGTLKDLDALAAPGPQTLQGRASVESLTIARAGVETRVLLENVDSVVFFRQPVAGSTLPAYVAASHFRHAATVILRDGSRLDGDYVNLGTTVVRGLTPQGRVDIPWVDVETISFQR